MALIKKFRIKSYKQPNPIISFENVSLSYGNRLILDNINFKINEGEIFGMLGPNGVGKSTIFNLITGLIKPDSGQIKINNTNVVDFPMIAFLFVNNETLYFSHPKVETNTVIIFVKIIFQMPS